MSERIPSRAASLAVAVLLALSAVPASARQNAFEPAFASIDVEELRAHLAYLAAPALEGRDSPSRGLDLAAEHIARHFAQAELAYVPDSDAAWRRLSGDKRAPEWSRRAGAREKGTFLRPFRTELLLRRPVYVAIADECSLAVTAEDAPSFDYGADYVPIAGCNGDASGELVFAGFGIENGSERYNDFADLALRGRVALIFDGEPRHPKRFDGADESRDASLWRKLDTLRREDVAGVLVARRRPPSLPPGGEIDLSFRTTWAHWNEEANDERPRRLPPALEISMECASALLGTDAMELAARIDARARPERVDLDVEVAMSVRTTAGPVVLHNVVAAVPGSDPELADEVVVVGAHYDHVGVGPRGRIAFGADDNASGTAALLEMAEAMALGSPRRSLLFCAFAAEEDGLIGSAELCASLPVPQARIVAMINLDMIGRGKPEEVAVLGLLENPRLKKILERARRLKKTGIERVTVCRDRGLFERSDHYSFHRLGIPSLFFLEGYPISRNPDYHTWRDTIDQVDLDKVANTTRLAFNTAWILANDDDRPPAPRD